MLLNIAEDAPRAALMSLGGTLLVIMFAFRWRLAGWGALLTLLLGISWLVGTLYFFDIKLNFLNFVAIPVANGAGADYAINIMKRRELEGAEGIERAFIESADRQVELFLLFSIANAVRHTHPGLAPLEQPQFADFGTSQGEKLLEYAAVFDRILATRPWLAGDRFTIADITGFCGIEFAKLIKFRPAEAGFTHLADWRERVAARPSAKLA